MATVFGKIKELETAILLSKHEQLINGILNSIDDKILVQGSVLPSVKVMSKEIGFASETVVKAYKELKNRGLVESRKRMGYYIVNEDTVQIAKVVLLMYAFHPFQEVFYNTFRNALGENVQVDVFFHHSNIDVFETILGNIKGQYSTYVIAPIPHKKTKGLLADFSPNSILLVDRYEKINDSFSHITQEFEASTYAALKVLSKKIKQYKEIVLFYKPNSDYPIGVLNAFKNFITDFEIRGSVVENYQLGNLKEGYVYFTIGDGDLWNILKDCKLNKWELGQQIGVFSNNDGPVKEIICGGITTFSTDFRLMAKNAAKFVLERRLVQEIIPTKIMQRNSL